VARSEYRYRNQKLIEQMSYWMLGAMCSTPELAGKLVAVYKGEPFLLSLPCKAEVRPVTQSVGAAIAYQLTTDNLSGRKQYISNWALIAGSLVVARE
jgi:hypothetical protein